MATSHVVASHITKLLSSFRQILEFRFRENQQERIPPWKVTKTKPFLSTCYGDPSATEVPPCCEAATRKLTFSTTSVLLLLDVPLSLSRGTIFRRQKNPRRGYRPKIAGILFVCNEPGRSIPYCAHLRIYVWRHFINNDASQHCNTWSDRQRAIIKVLAAHVCFKNTCEILAAAVALWGHWLNHCLLSAPAFNLPALSDP